MLLFAASHCVFAVGLRSHSESEGALQRDGLPRIWAQRIDPIDFRLSFGVSLIVAAWSGKASR